MGKIPEGPRIAMPEYTNTVAWNDWKHKAENTAEMVFSYGLSVACPIHPKEMAPKPCMCCDHCTEQDPVHPVGIVLMPKKYFLCRDCFNLLERHRFDLAYDLKIQCRKCVKKEILRISQIDPTLCDDLSIAR